MHYEAFVCGGNEGGGKMVGFLVDRKIGRYPEHNFECVVHETAEGCSRLCLCVYVCACRPSIHITENGFCTKALTVRLSPASETPALAREKQAF